jgi:hypothetical protein
MIKFTSLGIKHTKEETIMKYMKPSSPLEGPIRSQRDQLKRLTC